MTKSTAQERARGASGADAAMDAGGAAANGAPAVTDASALATAFEGRVGGVSASRFVEDAFDSQDFVAKARRTMPLDDLLSELQAHLLKLRECLVDTINQDYTAFVGMASNLKGLDEALSRVRSPLENLRAEIDELRTAAAQAVKQLEGKLSERESILAVHRRLELLLDAEQGLQRMEALLLREEAAAAGAAACSGDGEGEGEGTSAAERAAEALRASEVLERIAHEAARLKGQVWRLDEEGAAGKHELLGRLALLEQQLLKRTSSIFGAAVAYREEEETSSQAGSEGQNVLAGREKLIQSCWRVYLVSGKLDECQSVLRQEAVRPFIAAAVTVKALEAGVWMMMRADFLHDGVCVFDAGAHPCFPLPRAAVECVSRCPTGNFGSSRPENPRDCPATRVHAGMGHARTLHALPHPRTCPPAHAFINTCLLLSHYCHTTRCIQAWWGRVRAWKRSMRAS